MFQHQLIEARNERPVPPEPCWGSKLRTHARKDWAWLRLVMSGRCRTVDKPHALHRHRVHPALVVPFLTILAPHTPQRGAFLVTLTEHALKACSHRHLRRSALKNRRSCTHISAANPCRSSRSKRKASMSASRKVGASSWMVCQKRATVDSSWSRRKVYSNKVDRRPAPNRVPPSSVSGKLCSQFQVPRSRWSSQPERDHQEDACQGERNSQQSRFDAAEAMEW